MLSFTSWHALCNPKKLREPPSLQRKCDAYMEAQRERRWAKDVENFRNIDNSELRIGVMGLGELPSMLLALVRAACEAKTPAAGPSS